jgi:leucyl/phenylalanyl-tRNA--protein transferase
MIKATFRSSDPLASLNEPLPHYLSHDHPNLFPDVRLADADGLVAIGGDLTVGRLLAGYRAGVFPWYDDDTPILWWSPDPRGIIEIDGLHISRRLARTVRSCKFRCTINCDFEGVLRGCADREEGTWITKEMHRAYLRLHKAGHAHSVEVWNADRLVGGLYGVALGGFFSGESMFHRERDASKVALVSLFDRLRQRGFELFDAQIVNEHTLSMGAIEVSRVEYLDRLARAFASTVTFD